MVIKTNGGQTGKFGAIFLIFIDEAQAAWDCLEYLDDTYGKWQSS
jgi:hypothetical protein